MASKNSADSCSIYVGNIPKTATESQLRNFFRDSKSILAFQFRLEHCRYSPTKLAFIRFGSWTDTSKALRMNQSFFQGKRLFVTGMESERNFSTRYTVMLKQLNEHVTEEDIYSFFDSIGTVEYVLKPAHNYAYVAFKEGASVRRALSSRRRSLKGVDMEAFPIKRSISMFLENCNGSTFGCIEEKCDSYGLVYNPGAENQTKLLVTNIPREADDNDVVEYLQRFGVVIDWEVQKSPTCVLTNNGYVTYQNAQMARNVFLHEPHNFQGVALDIYNELLECSEEPSDVSVILKRTSVYLTNDEIFKELNECGVVKYVHRTDTVNYHTVVRFLFSAAASLALKVRRISEEPVSIRKFSSNELHSPMAAPTLDPNLDSRIRKEDILRKIIYREDQANLNRLTTAHNMQYVNPNPLLFSNEVVVRNFPTNCVVDQFREFFKKCGMVVNYRAVRENPTTMLAVLSFATRLESRRACQMNQSFMNGKRLVIYPADQVIEHDPDLCVKVTGLYAQLTDEDIYDRFQIIGAVRYVLRDDQWSAIVCMAKKRWRESAIRVSTIKECSVQVLEFPPSSMMHSNGANMPPNGAMMGHGAPTMRPNGPMMGPGGPIMGHSGPMMGPTGPMMGPGHLVTPPVRSVGATEMSSVKQMNSPKVTPAMHRLMQIVESSMSHSNTFKSLEMMMQFNVVHGIVNQFINYPNFPGMNPDQQIKFLISGNNDFEHLSTFTLFTYPEQLQMLSIIQTDYLNTVKECSTTPSMPQPVPAPSTTAIAGSSASSMAAPWTQNANPNGMTVRETYREMSNRSRSRSRSPSPYRADMPTEASPPPYSVADSDDESDRLSDSYVVPPAPEPPTIFGDSRSPSPDMVQRATSRERLARSERSRVPFYASRSPSPYTLATTSLSPLAKSDLRTRLQTGTVSPGPSSPPLLPLVRNLNSKTSKVEMRMLPKKIGTIFVSNLPIEVTSNTLYELFGIYGNILDAHLQTVRDNNSVAAVITYDTMKALKRSRALHLKEYRGRLLRVAPFKQPYLSRSGYAVNVTCSGHYSELEMFNTFKMCGRINCIWTRDYQSYKYCVIDFKSTDAVREALQTTHLSNGYRCKVSAFE